MEIRRARPSNQYPSEAEASLDRARQRQETMALTGWDEQELHEAGPERVQQRLSELGHTIVGAAELEEAS